MRGALNSPFCLVLTVQPSLRETVSLTPAPHSRLSVSRPPHPPVPCLESLRSCQSPHPLSSVFCAGRAPHADSVSGQKALSLRIRALRASFLCAHYSLWRPVFFIGLSKGRGLCSGPMVRTPCLCQGPGCDPCSGN